MPQNLLSKYTSNPQALHETTSTISLLLYISFGIVRRIESPNYLLYVLMVAAAVNVLAVCYVIWCAHTGKQPAVSGNRFWLYFKAIANACIILLTATLLK